MARKQDIGFAAVARTAGVSQATVSNTLNRPEIVSEKTRAKVMAAIAELDFVPNRAAATLRQGNSRLIGLVVPDIENPFYSAITRGITEAAEQHDYTVALCVTDDDASKEIRQYQHLAGLRVAGALVVAVSADASRLGQLRTVGTRLVLIDRAWSTHDGCSVAVDDVLGGRIAAEHLLATRGDALVLVNGPASIPQCADRRSGARAALSDRGIDPDRLVEVEVAEMTIEAGREAGRRLADAGPLPSGIFCTNDLLAVGVIRGLADGGVRVPQDVAVVGYGDLSVAADGMSALTSVVQPKADFGRAAMRLLLDEIRDDGSHAHASTLFAPTLVVRDSAPA